MIAKTSLSDYLTAQLLSAYLAVLLSDFLVGLGEEILRSHSPPWYSFLCSLRASSVWNTALHCGQENRYFIPS
jgi:hypothetical protein